ncbi:hypothetical protein T492DRAFT_879332 [Pavlovales sp. CCMP2436]|nr:hypothetical protein T492DRAFT_879332 [Pavlovales sp. CCMP2436]
MIRSKGMEAVVRDDLIGNVLFFGCLIGGAISAFLGCIIAFASGGTAAMATTELVQSATATIFVSYCDDPDTLARTHPAEFKRITDAYTRFYPEAMGEQQRANAPSQMRRV